MRLSLVEDEAKVAHFIVCGLEAERFAVDVATDSRAALELATTYGRLPSYRSEVAWSKS
jgi:DNA-binding response OmpR family regulator